MNVTNQLTTCDQATHADLIHCLWMQAGVVDYKLCDREYDCEHCPFDEALHCRPAEQVSISADRHHDDAAMLGLRNASSQSVSVQGCEVARNLFYHSGHTWARIEEGGTVRAGLDDFGQRMLGPAYSLTLPSPNRTVRHGEECWRFTHQSGVTPLLSPVSGRVKEINSNLLLRPALVNRDPYGDGWTVLIEPTELKSSLKQLMYGERVSQWLEQEIEKLRLIISRLLDGEQATINTTMTDGGLLTREVLSGLTVAQMRRVISSFFPSPSVEEPERNNAILVQNGR
jgi:glycine cleavage system H lipoate-binding protein